MKTEPMYLRYFTQDNDFPFFIQDGHHDKNEKMHYHADFYELVIVLDGTAKQELNGRIYYIKRGDVFVLGEGLSHIFLDPQKLHICNIMFHPGFLAENCYDLRQLPGYHALFIIEPYLSQNDNFHNYLKLTPLQFQEVSHIINQLYSAYHSGETGRKNLSYAYFQILVTYLSKQYTLPDLEDQHYGSFEIAHIASFLEEHFTQDHSIDELAKRANLSKRHFMRLFSRTYHTSPHNYLLQLRLQYACSLLESEQCKLSITEIAYESGFQNNNYFSRIFRKTYGMSPRDYRFMQQNKKCITR